MSGNPSVTAALAPRIGLSVAVTGHRDSHSALAGNGSRLAATMARVFDLMDSAVAAVATDHGAASVSPTRLHCMLVDGVDQMAARAAIARGWSVVAPLPFGRALNLAVNARPTTAADAKALLGGGKVADAATRARAEAISELTGKAHVFELAERDRSMADLFIRRFHERGDADTAFAVRASERVAVAARVMIEQSDILIGVWDGASEFRIGGTGHTIATALELGAAVVWIDAHEPEVWHVLRAPEALGSAASRSDEDRHEALSMLVRTALLPPDNELAGTVETRRELWAPQSKVLWHAYRRAEALFDGEGHPFRSIRQRYERPDEVADGSGAGVIAAARAVPGAGERFVDLIESRVLQPFAWFDGISAYLSDRYRAGMILNFMLAAAAVIAGIAYQPLGLPKWIFAGIEFLCLGTILFITWTGQKQRWHGRWFDTRRVAEYLRHAPTTLLLGVARPPGRWPVGRRSSWPEYYARHRLRSVGLPPVTVSAAYLRGALECLLYQHVIPQRDYHQIKARRLTTVHRRLDKLSESLFLLAVASVSIYLALSAAVAAGLFAESDLAKLAKVFTFFAVSFPTLGAAMAGIRYFGDFERFAAISDVTAGKLDALSARAALLLTVPDSHLDYARAAELARLTDEVVFSEIENWQAVFGGKHITVPL